MYLPKEELFQRSSELLGVDVSYMEKHLMDLSMERKVIQKEEGETVLVYPSRFYYLELNTARMLRELNIDCPEAVSYTHLTPEPSPAPEPDKMDQKAVVKNGNITMVNEYLVNGNKTDDKETDSRTGENSENAESPEPETDNGSDTGDQEDIIEE